MRGADLTTLPDLLVACDALMFLPNLEVAVERLHAFVSQRLRIAHHHSPAYVSVTLRRAKKLKAHSGNLDSLVNCVETVSNRRQAILELGLAGHPEFSDYLTTDGKIDFSIPHFVVNKVHSGNISNSVCVPLTDLATQLM